MTKVEHEISIEWWSGKGKFVGLCACGLFKTKPHEDKRKIVRAGKAHCLEKNGTV